MTFAPMSANIMEQKGPAKTLVRSSTVTFDNAAFENIDTTFFLSDFAEKNTCSPGSSTHEKTPDTQ